MNRLRITLLATITALGACDSLPKQGVEEQFNFFPLARYETSTDPPGYSVDALWPLVSVERSGEASASRVLPLYAASDDGHGKTFRNILLLYWQTLDAASESIERTLFPLFHYVRAPGEQNTHVWPFWGIHRYGGEPGRRTDSFAWPLFEYDRALDGSQSELGLLRLWQLFALLHRERADSDGQTARTRVVTALGDEVHLLSTRSNTTQESDDDGEGTVETRGGSVSLLRALPIFQGFESVWQRTPTSHDRFRLLSLFDQQKLSLVTYDSHADGDESRTYAHLFPLYFHGSSPEGDLRLLLPLWGSQRRGDSYSRQWILPPLFAHETDPATGLSGTDVLWPLGRLAHEGTGENAETHFRALPLLWFTTRPDSQVDLVLPLYYHIRDAHDDYLHVVPLFGRHHEDDGAVERTFVLAPLYVHTTDQRTQLRRTDWLWPLSSFERDAGGHTERIFPLFFHRTRPHASHTNALLLFDHQTDADGRSTVLYPLWASRTSGDQGSRTSLLPLLDLRFLDDEPPAGDELSLLHPLVSFTRDGDDVARWGFPFYWWFDDGAGESIKHVWPLYGVHRSGTRVKRSVLWPFFFAGSDDADAAYSALGLLYPLGYAGSGPGGTCNRFLPLWYHAADTDAGRTWVLWPLFSRTREADRSSWHSLFYLLRGERDPSHEEFSVLYALYRSRREADRLTRSVPFLFHYEDEAGSKTLRLFHLIPIRFGSAAGPDQP